MMSKIRLHQHRGKAHGRFVQHQDMRIEHQAARHRQHLLFAAGERAALLLMRSLQTGKETQTVLHAAVDLGAVVDREGAHLQVFLDGQRGEDAAAFRDMAHAGLHDQVRVHVGDVLVLQDDFALLWMDQAGDGAQGGAFAGAVGADEGDDLAFLDVQRDPLQGMDAPVVAVNVFQVRAGSCTSPPCGSVGCASRPR